MRPTVRVPANNGVPADLPAWARDELVRRRLECSDLKQEIIRLRFDLARARGRSLGDMTHAVHDDPTAAPDG